MALNYRDAGVNLEWGNDASKILYNAAKTTWDNRKGTLGEVISPTKGFSGLRGIRVGGLPEDTISNMNFDGVGTKMELAERLMKHDTIAFDLFAMVCDDAAIRGAEPVLIGSVLDVRSLGVMERLFLQELNQLAQGYIAAAKAANVAIVNGEVAELGARVTGYGDFNYNWSAGLVWFAREERLITGLDVQPGDKIVAFREHGFRSNGLSLVRKILQRLYGDNWHQIMIALRALAEKILTPSTIYSPILVDLFGGVLGEPTGKINAAAHITGGGIPEKLGRALEPSGYGAALTDLFDPPEIMQQLQEMGEVGDEDFYKTWNGGQGMLVVTPEPDTVINIAKRYGVEAQIVGGVVEEPGITIISKASKYKEVLTFA